MANAASISQSSDGKTLVFSYTTSLTVTGAILTIYDSNGVLLETLNMGTVQSAMYTISSDVYLTFTVNINNGTIVTVNYISTQFYKNGQAQLASLSNLPCGCSGITCSSFVKAREAINAAETFYAIGDAQSSQLNLTAADYYILNPTY